MHGMVIDANASVSGRGLTLIGVNIETFKINQLLLINDTALIIEPDEKLSRPVKQFGGVLQNQQCCME